jgi:hypothetical protein
MDSFARAPRDEDAAFFPFRVGSMETSLPLCELFSAKTEKNATKNDHQYLHECARLREGDPYNKVHRYNPKHLRPKFNAYGDNGQRKVWSTCGSTHCTYQLTSLN